MVNVIWGGMFIIAVLTALFRFLFEQDIEVFSNITKAIFDNAKLGVDISITLIGILSFWLGILKIIEETGIAQKISKKLYPLFSVIMKDIPKDSPAISVIVMNMAANFLGLDNAATPMGIKAMEQLQVHNPKKDEASDEQILFMVLNASSVTFIPVTIFMYRAQMGATHPTDVFIPILIATSVSTMAGFLFVALKQKIDLSHPLLRKIFAYFLFFIVGMCFLFSSISAENRMIISSLVGNMCIVLSIGFIIYVSLKNKLKSYEIFIDGAKEGFGVAIKIIPYLVSMLVAIGVFRASGVLDFLLDGIKGICSYLGFEGQFIGALPTAFMKPLSGSGARAMMIETMNTYGADSFEGFLASVIQGSTETTFYVLTVYFGAINISKTRYALKYGLLSDLVGIVTAIGVAYLFYGK